MDFLKNNRRFDFLYGGKPFAELTCETRQTEEGDTLTTVYTLPDGLKITNIATRHGDAYEWVNWWENTSDTPTEIISDLWNASVAMPMPHEEPAPRGVVATLKECTAIYAPTGSNWEYDDFCAHPDVIRRFIGDGHLGVGIKKTYATSGGRSSEKHAPFFNVHKDNKGYIFAIGWTGQWNSCFERTADTVIAKAKIEDTHFRLLPGEKIRTASFVVMPYEGTAQNGQNKWRRLVKKDFSLIGKEGRDQVAPLCAELWGGTPTDEALEHVRTIKENGFPADYFWMDAAWFGKNSECSSGVTAVSDWWDVTGDWSVSPLIHPNGLKPIADAVHEAGMKYLLWVEPERAGEHTEIVAEHPEYFCPKGEGLDCLLLNLGHEGAWQHCYQTVTNLIDEIGIDCYRQDFNWDPLEDWRRNDTPDRRGITEIKHMMGLYRLLDALLERYPHLLIDNCASGGRRMDIEMLRRSVTLWRSDYQCYNYFRMEGSQSQSFGFSTWFPYSGTCTGRIYDTYRMRSAYGPAMCFTMYFGKTPEELAWMRGMLEEYVKIRPYMSEDFYPLTEVTERKDTWSAAQYNRPEENDGMIQLFRREKSPYEMASFKLFDLDAEADYVFTDTDTGEQIIADGQTLMTRGLVVTMAEPYSSRIYFYKKK